MAPGVEDEAGIVRAIREKGWTQGSVLPGGLAARVAMYDGTPLVPERERAIIVNVPCDVVNRRLASEPVVEIVRAQLCDAIDPNYAARRNPRVLHLALNEGGLERPAAIRAYDRGQLERRALADEQPDAACTLPGGARELLAEWMAARYQRTALPDAFNDALTAGKRRDRLKRLMREAAEDVLAVYVLLSPMAELSPPATYQVIMRGVMTKKAFDDGATREHVTKRFWEPLLALMAEVNTIVVRNAALVSEQAFPLYDLRRMQRLEFDFLSYEGEVVGPLAPRGA